MTDVFDSNAATTASSTEQPAVENKLALLVGEGRKYATVEALAEAYLNADQFVETLKEENAKFREERKKQMLLEEHLKRTTEVSTSSTQTTGAQSAANAAGLTEEQIARIVEQQISGRETAKTREQNLIEANRLMEEKFGERAKEIFRREANTPELVASYKKLAEVAPKKFLALFTSEPSQTQQTSTGSTVNTGATQLEFGGGVQPGTKAYYNKMRKENPSLYYSQATQLKMLEDAKNRERFFGRSN